MGEGDWDVVIEKREERERERECASSCNYYLGLRTNSQSPT